MVRVNCEVSLTYSYYVVTDQESQRTQQTTCTDRDNGISADVIALVLMPWVLHEFRKYWIFHWSWRAMGMLSTKHLFFFIYEYNYCHFFLCWKHYNINIQFFWSSAFSIWVILLLISCKRNSWQNIVYIKFLNGIQNKKFFHYLNSAINTIICSRTHKTQ